MKRLILVFFFAFVAAVAFAEEVFVLKDGSEYVGKLSIESPDRLVLLTPDGKVTIQRKNLKERRPGPSPIELFEDRSGKTKAEDHVAWRKLARWARDRGMETQSQFAYQKVLAAKPGDGEAKKALGADEDDGDEEENPAAAARAQLRAKLSQAPVDFDFQRESLETIFTALARAADVSVTIDKSARKEIKKRGIRLRYKARTDAMTVIEGITKSTKLDFELTADGVVIGTIRSIRSLRKKLGLKKGRKVRRRVSPEEAKELLETSKHTIQSINRPLRVVINYLKENTPLPYLYAGPPKALEKKVLFDVYQMPLAALLDRTLHPLDLDWVLQGNTVYISTKAEIERISGPSKKK